MQKLIHKEVEILDKIDELFEFRQLPEMMKRLGLHEPRFRDFLVELQYRIFLYDKYLESVGSPKLTKLSALWDDIRCCLLDWGYTSHHISILLGEIKTYALNELSTREGIRLSTLPMSYFYYYKSCDVRLMRKLIYLEVGEASLLPILEQWILFDWVTEVNDDVMDIFEDSGTFNGNRFLTKMKHEGRGAAIQEYVGFLNQLDLKLRAVANRTSGSKWTWAEIVTLARRAVIDTKNQLHLLSSDERLMSYSS